MFYFYILFNKSINKFYIGQTINVENRLKYHNKLHKVKFTSKQKGEWKVVYTEQYATRSEAIRRERQIKSYKSRKFIEELTGHGILKNTH